MLIIGGYVNTSIPGISEIILGRDKKALLELVQKQLDGGAEIIAVNCGSHLTTEKADLLWAIDAIQQQYKVPICVDTPNAGFMAEVLPLCKYGRPIIDSTTLEDKRIKAILPLAKQFNARLIVLMHDESGMPYSAEDRLKLMDKVEALVKEYGMAREDIFLDCLVFPCSVDTAHTGNYLKAVELIRKNYPGYQFCCGMDNISFGMCKRELINAVFLSMLAQSGQEAVMIKLTPQAAAALKTIKLLSGEDEMGLDFIEAYKNSELDISF